MIRLLVASFLIGGPALALAPTGPNPPDSFDPGGPRSLITFTHKHQRVLSCEAKRKQDKLTCKAKKDQADPTTLVRLTPVRTPDITGEDQRREVTLSLSPDGEEARKEITLGAGVWSIEWAARKTHERFRVANDQPFTIKLNTTSGACVAKDKECRLDASKVAHKVRIPGGRVAK